MTSNESVALPILSSLTHKRTTIKGLITRYTNKYIKNTEHGIETVYADSLSSLLKKVEELEAKFEAIQSEIEDKIDESEVDLSELREHHADERISIEESLQDLKSLIRQGLNAVQSPHAVQPTNQEVHIVSAPTPAAPTQTATSSITSSRVASRLPEIKLPEFNGEISTWLSFCQLFRSLIDDDDRLTDAQRLLYLKTSLKGEAYNTIASLPPTGDNYEVAWTLLKGRYENKRVLIKTHLNNLLFKLPAHTMESATSLRHLLDVVATNVTALTSLGLPTSEWDEILIQLIQVKIDKQTQRDWEQSIQVNGTVSYENFTNFIQQKCATLEVLSSSQRQPQPSNAPLAQPRSSTHRFTPRYPNNSQRVYNASLISSCPLCKGSHRLYACNQFLDRSVNDRRNFLNSQQRCHNCFWLNHKASTCTYGACKYCQKPHHTLLHEEPSAHTSSAHHSAIACLAIPPINPSECIDHFLPTALVYAYDKQGITHTCRVLFDSGSQCNFARTDLMRKLNSPLTKTNIQISTIGNQPSQCTSTGNVHISSRFNSFNLLLSCVVVDQVTGNIPSRSFSIQEFQLPHVPLADPKFAQSQQIDLLIGVNDFWNSLRPESMKASSKHPHLQNTQFGWVVGGRATNNLSPNVSAPLANVAIRETPMSNSSDEELHEVVARLFRCETDTTSKNSPAEDACETHFRNTHAYCPVSKRFTVRLPFKHKEAVLGDSYKGALRRFHALEARLKKEPELQRQYDNFMSEYLNLNHMSVGTASSAKYYLPHHCVVRADKSTTKVRVVFDASANTSNSLSLNDILYAGPTIQNTLFSILLRFRTHQFVLCADVEKMYRQILVHSRDRPYQAILWRDQNGTLRTYFLNTVTYGMTCAPYLAIKCLLQTTNIAPTNEVACEAIRNDFYVDDLLTGADSVSELHKLKTDINKILIEGGFQLRKWSSNHTDLAETDTNINLDKNHVAKLLGIQWNSLKDNISYSCSQLVHADYAVTKRTILSHASKLFDPLGLLSPIIIISKLILRKLWTHNLEWDDPIPQELREQWEIYIKELIEIQNISIPRKVICAQSHKIEIHGFCDASQEAYGAAIYLRSIASDNKIQSFLLCSRSRVSPIRTITIPRLELCSAVLLANLMDKCKMSLRQCSYQSYYWTDSTIVISWLNAPGKHKQVFIANRIAEIHSLSATNSWRHVRSADNSADIITRGCNASDLINNSLWWHGPSWLTITETNWPETALPKITVHIAAGAGEWTTLQKFSNLQKLLRVLSYCLRFIKRCKSKGISKTLLVSAEELADARIKLMLCVQQEGFSKKAIQDFSNYEIFRSLNPFIDNNGILRVGGRLTTNVSLTYDKRHPIILPRQHHITKLIIRTEHERLLHAGPAHTLASIRESYWPLSAKAQVRTIIHDCIPCRKAQPRTLNQLMGNLPSSRTTPTRPFLNSGVDYAGPIQVLEARGRGRRSTKAYIALFVCFATKAIHVELVSDCSSAAFIAALHRFVSRRGMVANLYSDNGTNFTGANAELQELLHLFRDESVATDIHAKFSSIKWHFIPPNSPHWGGLWEAGIKIVKTHLKRVIGEQKLTYEEYGTLLTQIEACVNSRPLYELSGNANDLLPLTPAHFLIGTSLTSIPEPTYLDVPINRLTRWQLVQQMVQHFWKRWSVEYLHELQQRPKWQRRQSNIQIGTLVLLREHNMPPFAWNMGRIMESYKGQDGAVRAVLVRTSKGVYKRTINRICILLQPSD